MGFVVYNIRDQKSLRPMKLYAMTIMFSSKYNIWDSAYLYCVKLSICGWKLLTNAVILCNYVVFEHEMYSNNNIHYPTFDLFFLIIKLPNPWLHTDTPVGEQKLDINWAGPAICYTIIFEQNLYQLQGQFTNNSTMSIYY